jgi:leucyl aminopeptidase
VAPLVQGSAAPPKFIHLTYKPPGDVKEVLAIVGKGVTFDSGGYNLKAGAGSLIQKMKFDMGGAAATFGAALAVAELAPANVEVHFISAACENMISGGAYRPGDVLTSAAGKTVEIGNTDAEGRLTLCDALHFAQTQAKATTVIDIATLTGAQIVALGMVRS